MKTMIAALAGLLLLTGCAGPLYTREGQNPRGAGFGLFGSGAATRARVERLAVDKLYTTPVQVKTVDGVPQGYYGVIVNQSPTRRLIFRYTGPESGSEYLGPGQEVEKYLLPGKYQGEILYGGDRVGWATFTSEPVQKTFLGKKVHWFFFAEW